MLYLAAFFALASSSFAQIETNAEQLKALDWATGSWHHEGVAARDTPHLKRDTKYSKEWKFVWTANKNALLITQLITVDGKPVGQLDSLFGWDKRAEQIVGAGFSTDGGAGASGLPAGRHHALLRPPGLA